MFTVNIIRTEPEILKITFWQILKKCTYIVVKGDLTFSCYLKGVTLKYGQIGKS